MNQALFQRFADLAYQRAGIALHEGKQTLVEARVGKRLRALDLPDAASYLDFLEADRSGDELVQFLDVITTNFTSFYREPDHFEVLDKALRRCVEQGAGRIRLWSAASSTGEEPYSIALTLLGATEHARVDARILATDLSTRALARAAEGIYSDKALNTVPPGLRERHFSPAGRNRQGDAQFQISSEIKRLLLFKRLNLATPPFPMPGPLDAVFCRNVMIYFDRPVRQRLVAAIEGLLKPGGLLFIGHTETLTGLSTGLRTVRPSIYQKPGGST